MRRMLKGKNFGCDKHWMWIYLDRAHSLEPMSFYLLMATIKYEQTFMSHVAAFLKC